ncbi:4'-phosphopantetheinyl transferase family protein [Micromonospora ureilytica]|uniref:4'-phosphopantetheinyl transferase family protein n=1 Tax=Micromonospora ureilytica TaxID=709868 RepID=UPI002E11CA94|nr:4'-phosphopantetheinyl transferase superfamily protein [Micromonospora ureilytica]
MEWVVVRIARVTGDPRDRASGYLVDTAADVLGVPAGEVAVARDQTGRPRLTGAARGLHASISHGRGVVAVAVSAVTEVGVDIERERALPGEALARRWMTAADADWLTDRPAALHTSAFLWLWTQKEAIGKARGTGLRGGGLRQPLALPPVWPDPLGSLPLRPVPGSTAGVACGVLPGGLVLAVAGQDRLLHDGAADGIRLITDPREATAP